MNKLLIYFFLFATYGGYGQDLMNFYIEPSTTSNVVDLHTGVYKSALSSFSNYDINTIDNTITVTLCYLNSSVQIETEDFQEFEINLPVGHSNYIINVEVYGDDDGVPCTLTNLVDTGILEFNYPYNPIDKITIPDDTFEAYLENLGFGDDVANNNLVYTHRFRNIGHLFLSYEFTLESLEGINELKRLKELRFSGNIVTEVDLSSNIMLERLFCNGNQLIQLDVSNNPLLEILICGSNSITLLNLANNVLLKYLSCSFNMIPSLDVSNNINLEILYSSGLELTSLNVNGLTNLRSVDLSNNQISTLDFSNNSQLETVSVNSNSLTSLNLKNGNNANIMSMNATFNNLLICVDVDDEIAANNGEFPYTSGQWGVDPGVIYSEDCSLGKNDFSVNLTTVFPNPATETLFIALEGISIEELKVYSMSGQVVLASKSITTSIDVSNLSEGIYFIEITTLKGKTTKKFIKQ